MKKTIILAASLLFSSWSMAQHSFTITAHTGAYGTVDNSMEFVDVSLAKNDVIMEIDIRQRPDGTVAMSHDTITSNADGVEVAKVLQKVKNSKTRINLDIKEKKALPALYKLIRENGMENQVFLTGIGIEDMKITQRSCPGIAYYLNYETDPKGMKTDYDKQTFINILKATGAIGVNCPFRFCTPEFVKLIHDNGFLISIWTVNEKKDMVKYSKNNPDNITTRHPDLLRETIGEMK